MTIFTAATLGTITTITAIVGVDNGEHFSALREVNKKELSLNSGVTWSLCRDLGDTVVDYYNQPYHHVKVEKVNIWDVLA
jgi:hypothetical protein